MRHTVLIAAVLTSFALFVAGCGGGSEEGASEPAKVENVSGQAQVVLSPEAAKRLGVQTARVRAGNGATTMIPFAAVLYDPDGATWTYTNPKPLVYVRKDVSVERIDGNRAFLKAGPPSGTPVVTVGATEIWGVEYGGIEED